MKDEISAALKVLPEFKTDEKIDDFVVIDAFAKSIEIDMAEVTKKIVAIVRREHVAYASFIDICQRS
jgi:hypothetical protein